MIRCIPYLAIILAAVAIAPAFPTGEPFKPGKLPPGETAALQQGLTLRFYASATDAKPLDARRVRLAALHVPANESATPFLAPGAFVAKFTGYIKNPLKGTFSFRVVGTGSIVVKINEKVVLNHPDAALAKNKEIEVELAKNYNRLEIDYVSPPKGDATMRLYWAGEKFGFEPVPPDVFTSRGDDTDLLEKNHLREGRLLYANHHCSACHALPGNIKPADCKMPELQSAAPRLDQAGDRFDANWLAAWILDPHALRPEATMPRVLTGPDTAAQASDIAAYLTSLKKAAPKAPGKATGGEATFKKYGCNSCHRLSDPREEDTLGRLSLHFVASKFTPGALAEFIKEPHNRHPWTRMPDFRLNDAEAGNLESYLRTQAKGKIAAMPRGDVQRGARLFQDIGCVNCHSVDASKRGTPTLLAKLGAFDKGCLAEKDRGKAPDFALKPAERKSLAAFLGTDGSSLTRETPAEFSTRQVRALQCASCHRRDGVSTRWQAVLEEDGKEPEKLPSLTWTGEKLKPAWAKRLFAGESDQSARPWIKARMPAFPARAEMLAVGLSHEHGFGVLDDDRPPPDAKLAAIGEKLIPQQGGFNCINCHGIGKTPPIAPFEAPGINLVDAAVRLRYEYYQRWMLAPDRVDVVMRMPVFAVDGKTTQLREVFDGDARQQFGALWHYIQTLPAKKQ